MTVCMTYPCRRTTGGCPICDPPLQYPMYTIPPAPVFHPPGCICPPTSEKTCQSPMCPRKGIRISAAGTPLPNGERDGARKGQILRT